jgi:superfamily II DNA helicase RecQ
MKESSKIQPSAKSILQAVFGYSSFRHNQEASVDHIIAGKDALVLMLKVSRSIFKKFYE